MFNQGDLTNSFGTESATLTARGLGMTFASKASAPVLAVDKVYNPAGPGSNLG